MRPGVRFISLWFALAPIARADEPPRAAQARETSDFAQGLRLAIQPQLSVQTLLLPLAVYRGMRPTHDDLAVFNAAGEPVPFALRTLHAHTHQREEEVSLPVFPIYEPVGQGAPAGSLRLRVERKADGTILDIAAPDAPRGPANAGLVAYIFDASKLEQPASRLKLALALGVDSATTEVQVEASDDLAAWSSVAASAVIGQLRHAGQSIARSEVEISPTRARFLRLRWQGSAPPQLHGALAVIEREAAGSAPAFARVTLDAARAQEHVYRLDLGGIVPLLRVAPRLPANTLIAGELGLSSVAGQTTVPPFTGQLYRLQHENTELLSPAVEAEGRRARYLTLRVDPRTDALPAALPFEVDYAPEQLLFVTRGPGAHVLAFGSYKQTAPAFDAEQLLDFLPEAARAALPLESARVDGAVKLGGAAARNAPPPARSYRMHVLWAVLIAGAGTLLVLALRMLRRMQP
jgi:hypothetical protein